MEAKITGVQQTTMMDPASKGTVPAVTVTYKIGDHGPFSETMPKEHFNPGTIKQKMETMRQHVMGLA